MKTLIFSDIHANIYALEAIWAREQGCDAVFCVGDLVDYGPYPRQVLDWIREREVICVQGNHDRWVAACYRSSQTTDTVPPGERTWAHYNAGLLDERDIRFLEQLPLTTTTKLDGISYGFSHMYEDYKEIVSLYAFDQFWRSAFAGADGGIDSSADGADPGNLRLVFGHTHRQSVRHLSNTKLWLNPGSASYRRRDDPDQTAHYATIVDGRLSLHRLAYDLRPVRRAMRQVLLSDSEREQAEFCFGSRPGAAAASTAACE